METLKSRKSIVVGDVFSRITVISKVEAIKKCEYKWLCECSCGKVVSVSAGNLRTGNTESCGCLRLERLREDVSTHGESNSAAYGVWCGMHSRCSNIKRNSFASYGGRGISVCERWNSFENFLSDIGHPPKGMTIERNDVNGNYDPANCRWIPRSEQSNNKTTSRNLSYMGKTQCLSEWAKEIGIAYWTLHARMRRGWSACRILETPVGASR